MYPRNNATPPRLTIGQVIQISDGAVQTSGVSVTTRGDGASEVAGSGTIEYGADGTVYYTPTQAETDYESFSLIANKASCFSCSVTVVTSASSTSGVVSANVTQISGDATAADNMELMYDGTGLVGDNFPSYQSQLSKIAVTGSAINTTYSAWSIPTGSVVSGTPDDTVARDGVYYQAADTGGTLDIEVDFDIGTYGVPTGVTFFGGVTDKNNDIEIQVYNFSTASFQKVGGIEGKDNLSAAEINIPLFAANVGTGVDEGRVTVKLYSNSLSSADLYIGQLFVSYSEAATPADVNAQVLDVFTVDTFSEPLAVPSATASLVDMIHWNFTVARNKLTQTATTTTLRNDADSATIASAQVSDDGTTFTRGEYL